MADYTYTGSDNELADWSRRYLTSRIGDGTGDHEEAYFNTLRLIMALRRGGSLLDIGAGFGRVVELATPMMQRVVALEPDIDRFRWTRDHYHKPPACTVLHQLSSDYLRNHPDARFDVVVISMVIQHTSTAVCDQLLRDAARLVQDDGVVVVSTTHAPQSASGYTYADALPEELYLPQETFDAYAADPLSQTRGVPVRRFSRAQLLACVEPCFELLHWEQFSWYRPERVPEVAERLQVPADELKDTGDSQFVVLRKLQRDSSGTDAQAESESPSLQSLLRDQIESLSARVETLQGLLGKEQAGVPTGYVDRGTQQLLARRYQQDAAQGITHPMMEVEFRNHSQTGEDGILNYLFSIVGAGNRTVVEIGAGDGRECNSANLIINHGWSALLCDGSEKNAAIARQYYANHPDTWINPPEFFQGWLCAENINEIVAQHGFRGEIDLLSIDVDGVDYWLWKAIDVVNPRVVVVEFQPYWMADRSVTVPYDSDFRAQFVDYPALKTVLHYCGASLPAMVKLGVQKGYRLVGTNRLSFNAFFVRNDIAPGILKAVDAASSFANPRLVQHYINAQRMLADYPWQDV